MASLRRLVLRTLALVLFATLFQSCTCSGSEDDWIFLAIQESNLEDGICPEADTPLRDSDTDDRAFFSRDNSDPLAWRRVDGASGYEIQFSLNEDMSEPFPTLQGLATNQLTFDDFDRWWDSERLTQDDRDRLGTQPTLYWQVRSQREFAGTSQGCSSRWSTAGRFTTNRSVSVELVSPDQGVKYCDDALVGQDSLTFQWRTEVKAGFNPSFRLVLDDDPNFATPNDGFWVEQTGLTEGVANLTRDVQGATELWTYVMPGTVPNNPDWNWTVSNEGEPCTVGCQSQRLNVARPSQIQTISDDQSILDCSTQLELEWVVDPAATHYQIEVYELTDLAGSTDYATRIDNLDGLVREIPLAGQDDYLEIAINANTGIEQRRLKFTLEPDGLTGAGNGEYVYRIRSVVDDAYLDGGPANNSDGECRGDWSEPVYFNVSSQAAAGLNPTAGFEEVFNCVEEGMPVTESLSWDALVGLTAAQGGYTLEIARDNTPALGSALWTSQDPALDNGDPGIATDLNATGLLARFEVDGVGTNTLDLGAVIAALPEGIYTWRVAGWYIPDGTTDFCPGTFGNNGEFTFNQIPTGVWDTISTTETPTPINFAAGTATELCGQTVTLRFNALDFTPETTGQYEVQVSTDSTFATVDTFDGPISSTELILGDRGLGTFYARHRLVPVGSAYCDSVNSWSPTWEYQTTPGLAKPVVFTPQPDTYCEPDFLFDWDDNVNAIEFEFELSTDSTFATVDHAATVTDSDYAYTIPASVTTQTTFYWRVRSVLSTCASIWSEVSPGVPYSFTFDFIGDPTPAAGDTLDVDRDASTGNIILSWDASAIPNHNLTRIFRRTGAFPDADLAVALTQVDAGEVAIGNPQTATQVQDPVSILSNDTTYYYRAWSCNSCNVCVSLPTEVDDAIYVDQQAPTIDTFTVDNGPSLNQVSGTVDVEFTLTATDNANPHRLKSWLVREASGTPAVTDFNTVLTQTNGVASGPFPAIAATTATVTAPDAQINTTSVGVITFYAWVIDDADRISLVATDSVQATNNLPSGSLTIISENPSPAIDAEYTQSDQATIQLTRLQAGTGQLFDAATHTWAVEISNTGAFTGTTQPWVGTPGDPDVMEVANHAMCGPCTDGLQTVYARYTVDGTQIGNVMNDTITLDTVAPTGSLALSPVATTVTTSNVVVNLSGVGGTGSPMHTHELRVSDSTYAIPMTDADYAKLSYVSVAPGLIGFTLPRFDADYRLQTRLTDRAGNVAEIKSSTITLQSLLPSGTFEIEAGATYATSKNVDIVLTSNIAVTGMTAEIKRSTATTWSSYAFIEDVVGGRTMTLSSGANTYTLWDLLPAESVPLITNDGTYTLNARLRGSVGTYSNTYTDTIFVDRFAPDTSTMSFTLPTPAAGIGTQAGVTYYNIASLTLTNLSAEDTGQGAGNPNSGIGQIELDVDGASTGALPFVAGSSNTVNIGGAEGTKTITLTAYDNAGNSATVTEQVHYDITAPTVTNQGTLDVSCLYTNTMNTSLTFSEDLAWANITAADVIITPAPPTAATVAQGAGADQMDIGFPNLTAGITYQVTFGPDVTDFSGNQVDLTGTPLTMVVNGPPTVSMAGTATNQTACVADMAIDLAALASDDGCGTLTYAWELVSAPAGSTATPGALGIAAATGTYTADETGSWEFRVQSSDGTATSAWQNTTVSFTNSAPTVTLTPNSTNALYCGGAAISVSLTATATDIDADCGMAELSYAFGGTAPDGTAVTITGATGNFAGASPASAMVSADLDQVGTYSFFVNVNDGFNGIVQDTVTVQVENTPPTASTAGSDSTVNAACGVAGVSAALTGAASNDPDASCATALTYDWQITAAPVSSSVALNTTISTAASFNYGSFDVGGTFTFTLSVSDGVNAPVSVNHTVTVITNNAPPVVTLGADNGWYCASRTMLLEATATDPDGCATSMDYEWDVVYAPPGSSLTTGQTFAGASWLTSPALVDGVYVFRITATEQPTGATSDKTETFIVDGRTPTISGAASSDICFDADRMSASVSSFSTAGCKIDTLNYEWELISQPASSTLGGALVTGAAPTLPFPDVEGFYQWDVFATDGQGNGDTTTFGQTYTHRDPVLDVVTGGTTAVAGNCNAFRDVEIDWSSACGGHQRVRLTVEPPEGGTTVLINEVNPPDAATRIYSDFFYNISGAYRFTFELTDYTGDIHSVQEVVNVSRPGWSAVGEYDFDGATNTVARDGSVIHSCLEVSSTLTHNFARQGNNECGSRYGRGGTNNNDMTMDFNVNHRHTLNRPVRGTLRVIFGGGSVLRWTVSFPSPSNQTTTGAWIVEIDIDGALAGSGQNGCAAFDSSRGINTLSTSVPVSVVMFNLQDPPSGAFISNRDGRHRADVIFVEFRPD